VRGLQEAGEDVVIQAFVPVIQECGEISIIVLDGEVSHAVRKLCASGDFRVQAEHGGREESIPVTEGMRTAALSALGTAERLVGQVAAYARVDMVWCSNEAERADDGDNLLLMELELIEPSLFQEFSEGGSDRFVDMVIRHMGKQE
jgi:glutathione synthase/RimK-type ligase-like ATP-grasp enzyme